MLGLLFRRHEKPPAEVSDTTMMHAGTEAGTIKKYITKPLGGRERRVYTQ